MNVGYIVKYKDSDHLPRGSVMVGKIIGVRMLNADDTRDLLCTVKWRGHDRTCDVWDQIIHSSPQVQSQTSHTWTPTAGPRCLSNTQLSPSAPCSESYCSCGKPLLVHTGPSRARWSALISSEVTGRRRRREMKCRCLARRPNQRRAGRAK